MTITGLAATAELAAAATVYKDQRESDVSEGEVRLGSQPMSLTCELSVVVGKVVSDTWVLLAVTVTVEVGFPWVERLLRTSSSVREVVRVDLLPSVTHGQQPTGTRQHSLTTQAAAHTSWQSNRHSGLRAARSVRR